MTTYIVLANWTDPGARSVTAWKTLGAVSADIDVAVSLLRQKAPDWSWSLQCLAGDDPVAFQALVADCSGQGVMGSLALCAAMLRALARRPPPKRRRPQTTRRRRLPGRTGSRKLDPSASRRG
ncbi:hypothetical protein BTHI11S_01070 [Bosea thiooxidans]